MMKAEEASVAMGAAIGGGIAVAVGTGLQALGKMVMSIGDLAASATELKTFAGSIAMTTNEAQRFGFVAERFNVPITAMAQGLERAREGDRRGIAGLPRPRDRDEDGGRPAAVGPRRHLDLADAFAGSNAEEAKL